MQNTSGVVKRWSGIIAVIFSLVVLIGGIYLVQRPRQAKKSSAASATVISITPSVLTKSKDDTFSVNVDIDTGENMVSAADVEIDYDATKLEGKTVTAGNFLPVVLVSGRIGSGKATIVLGSQPADPKKGTGTLATVTFKVLVDNTTTLIEVSSNTKVAAIGEEGNVLTTRNPSNVTIGAPASIEPTAPPTEAPTASPTVPPTTPPTEAPSPTPTEIGATPTPTGTGVVPGDINGDGIVNIVDLGIIIDNYGSTTPSNPKADINGDGVVDIVDLGIIIDNYQI